MHLHPPRALEVPRPPSVEVVDGGLGFWAAILPAVIGAAGSIYSGKQAKSAQKSAQKHEIELAKIAAETEARRAALAGGASSGASAGTNKTWMLVAGIGAVALLGVVLLRRRGAPDAVRK